MLIQVWLMIAVGVVVCTFVLCFLSRVRVFSITPGGKHQDGKYDPELHYDITFLFISGTLINRVINREANYPLWGHLVSNF